MDPIPETLRTEASRPLDPDDDSPAPRSRAIAQLMDNAFRVPGTQMRIGVDPILGFLPGIGDAISACFGFAILFDAARCRVSRWTQLKIATNVLINAAFGAIPIVGDLFSASFKSNARNYNLLARDLSERGEAFAGAVPEQPGFPWFAATLIGAVLLLFALVAVGIFLVVRQLFF